MGPPSSGAWCRGVWQTVSVILSSDLQLVTVNNTRIEHLPRSSNRRSRTFKASWLVVARSLFCCLKWIRQLNSRLAELFFKLSCSARFLCELCTHCRAAEGEHSKRGKRGVRTSKTFFKIFKCLPNSDNKRRFLKLDRKKCYLILTNRFWIDDIRVR